MKKSVIVIGTGPDWKDELLTLLQDESLASADIMAVNAAIPECPVPITHAVSMHPHLLKKWLKDIPQDQKPHRHTHFTGDFNGREWVFEKPWMNLNSGFFAIRLAKELEYDTIYLVGMDGTHQGCEGPFKSMLPEIKDQFANVVIPDHYWWKELVHDFNTQ